MSRPGSKSWWALGAVFLTILCVGVDSTVLSVALPTLAKSLHASETDLQWFSSGYFLVLAAAMLPAGLLGDRYGHKRVFLISLGLFAAGFRWVRLLDHGDRVHGLPGATWAGRRWGNRDGDLLAHGAVLQGGAAEGRRNPRGRELPGHADRSHSRRLAAHQLLVGLGIPDQRADRLDRLRGRLRPAARIPGREAAGIRPSGHGRVGGRVGVTDLWADQGRPGRLE